MAEIDDLDTTDANNSARFPEGQNPSTVNDGARALEGMLARAWFDAVEPASITASASTSNAWNITPNRSITCAQGLRLCFVAPAGNSGAVTIDIGDGKGAHALEQANGSAFSGGEIPKDQFVEAMFEASASVWQALSYAGITASSTDTLTNKTIASTCDLSQAVIVLPQGATQAPTVSGDIRFGTNNDEIVVGDGSGTATFSNDATLASTSNGKGASLIGIEDSGGLITATTVEGALAELAAASPLFTWIGASASTSGTTVGFTGIPSTATMIVMRWNLVSGSGTDDFLVQIGDSGGYETTGYESSGCLGATEVTSTSGFIVNSGGASSGHRLVMVLFHEGSNFWSGYHVGASAGGINGGAGIKTLSGTLDRIQAAHTGSDTWDGGSMNVGYL